MIYTVLAFRFAGNLLYEVLQTHMVVVSLERNGAEVLSRSFWTLEGSTI
jgi:hypothetical protein